MTSSPPPPFRHDHPAYIRLRAELEVLGERAISLRFTAKAVPA